MKEERIQNNGGYVKMLRANHLTQKQVAAITNLSANTIQAYARDIRGIRIGHLQDIAKYLGVDPEDIIKQMLYFDKIDKAEKKKNKIRKETPKAALERPISEKK